MILNSNNITRPRRRWTKDELKLAFYLYCVTPYGRLHSHNPDIISLANLLVRTPDSVAMKLCNFASLDPSITATGRVGLAGASRLDRETWNEFHANWEELVLETDKLRHDLQAPSTGSHAPETNQAKPFDGAVDQPSTERMALARQRLGQQFFRKSILSGYRGRCCMSKLADSRFLVASHIVAWSEDVPNRLNPQNGLCLSVIHDKAFDSHLITLDDQCHVLLTDTIKNTNDDFLKRIFYPLEGKQIELPERFLPEISFIKKHREIAFGSASISA